MKVYNLIFLFTPDDETLKARSFSEKLFIAANAFEKAMKKGEKICEEVNSKQSEKHTVELIKAELLYELDAIVP